MNFRRTLGVATAVTAVTLWPGFAAAQDDMELQRDSAEVDVDIAPGELQEEEAAEAEEMGSGGAEIIVDQPAPRIIVDQPSPDIVVEQPAPEVTIEQPAPEVHVQQPEPRVRVRSGEPEVEVRERGEPEVQIQRSREAEIEMQEEPLQAEEQPLFEEEPAPAQEMEPEAMFEPMPEQDRDDLILDAPVTDFGATLMVGGGVTNFTQSDLTDSTSVGGFWDVRGAVGTRSIVGLEAAYHGNSRDIQAIGLRDETFLVGNGLEAALRLNAPLTFEQNEVDVLVEPFAFGGVGWSRYNLFNEGVNTSDVIDQDDVLTVPVGVGIGGSVENVYLDARFTYRPAFGSDLVGDATGAFEADSLSSWGLGAHLGFEF